MQENRLIQPRTGPYTGIWMPPRQIYGSQKKSGDTTDKFYYFNGEVTTNVDGLPAEAEAAPFKTISMYHDHDFFWMVPYDATALPVGNGLQDEIEPDSDEDAEGDSDEEPDRNAVDWTVLYFLWRNVDWASEVSFTGNQQRLKTQRPDQHWANELLPSRNQATNESRTDDIRYGGLFGDLGILLGLVALSVKPSHVDAAMRRVVKGVTGDGAAAGWRRHNLAHHPRTDRRGVLIKIWTYPPYSTPQTLMDMEAGRLGLIYR
ncbi:hypothetical protein EJ08DRAFT_11110 [Tothia fuscella]|uniref:Uncharacterized protein n=1 Tax=Tothia fuscella TaxID=1048955 RepID=A0A9P4P416_9PEZI|nr:hypothetical protein EJ08DRAFT_11110 [Tothia fuscella]